MSNEFVGHPLLDEFSEGKIDINQIFETPLVKLAKTISIIFHPMVFSLFVFTLIIFDNNENQYMPEISMVKTIDNLISKILKLNNDLSFQNEVYPKQLILAKQYINIDSDSSTNSIIKHIINENKERY